MIDRMNRYDQPASAVEAVPGLIATQTERLAMLEKKLAEAVSGVAVRFAPVIVHAGPREVEDAEAKMPTGSEMGQQLYRIANGIERYIGGLHQLAASADC